MSSIDSIKTLFDKSKDYLETKIELTKLKTIDRSADVLASAVVMFSVLFFGFLFVLFIGLALALFLGRLLGAYHYGFLIIGGLFGIILLVIYVQRDKWIKTPITTGLINKMLK
jgi:hypothetical protein